MKSGDLLYVSFLPIFFTCSRSPPNKRWLVNHMTNLQRTSVTGTTNHSRQPQKDICQYASFFITGPISSFIAGLAIKRHRSNAKGRDFSTVKPLSSLFEIYLLQPKMAPLSDFQTMLDQQVGKIPRRSWSPAPGTRGPCSHTLNDSNIIYSNQIMTQINRRRKELYR